MEARHESEETLNGTSTSARPVMGGGGVASPGLPGSPLRPSTGVPQPSSAKSRRERERVDGPDHLTSITWTPSQSDGGGEAA